jgi:cytochrome P450
MVLKETMRMYPPVWLLSRVVQTDVEVAGIPLRAGEGAMVCAYTVQRHPEYWDEPDSFLPERFSSHEFHKHHDEAYLPFAKGNHLCIGMHLAMLELTLTLAALAQRFRVEPLPGHIVEAFPGVTLRMKSGLPAQLRLR